MPPLPKDLEGLLAAAGRAEADERCREKDAREQEKREQAEHAAAEAQAQKEAPSNVATIFEWLVSTEAKELRATMRLHGLERVRVGTYGIVHGERRPGPSFGGVSVDALAGGGLHVNLIRGYIGNRSQHVASATELLTLMPDRAMATLADELRAGKVLDLVAGGLAAARSARG